MNQFKYHVAGSKGKWLRKLVRFLFAFGLMLILHFQLTEFASWVCWHTAPPNVSPDAVQPWMDRLYVPAYADYSLAYATGILLAGNILTAAVFYLLGRKRCLVERWAVAAALPLVVLGELFSLFFMHPW